MCRRFRFWLFKNSQTRDGMEWNEISPQTYQELSKMLMPQYLYTLSLTSPPSVLLFPLLMLHLSSTFLFWSIQFLSTSKSSFYISPRLSRPARRVNPPPRDHQLKVSTRSNNVFKISESRLKMEEKNKIAKLNFFLDKFDRIAMRESWIWNKLFISHRPTLSIV